MSEQLTLTSDPLPVLLVATLAAMEAKDGRRPSVLTPSTCYMCSRRRWWIDVIVDGRAHYALLGRTDLEAAAADLYHQVHGAAPGTIPTAQHDAV
jgi:hypothetical protein